MEMDLSIWLQLAVVLVCVAVGGRLGGVGLGADNKIAHDQHQHIIRRYFSAQQAVSASVFLFWAWAFSRGLLRPASCSLLRQ